MTDSPPKRGRGRPRLANPRRRILHVRCTAEELAAIQEGAAATGMSVGGFFLDQALKRKPPRAIRAPQIDRERLDQVLAELRRLGPWVNDLAHQANAGGIPDKRDVVAAAVAVIELRDALKVALDPKT